MAQQFTLPDWARMYGQQVDLRSSPYWAAQDVGSGSMTLGGGDGSGFYGLLNQFAGKEVGAGDGSYNTRPDIQGATDFLGSSGQQMMQAYGGNNEVARWLQDAQGNITGAPELSSLDDDNFGYAAMLAAAVTGANLYGAYGGAAAPSGGAAAAPEAGIKTMGTIAQGSEALAPIATTGAQAGPAPGGLFGGLDMGKIGGGLLDYAAKNPKVVGGLLGGVAGATGGLDSGSNEAPYTGPMPTISRGGWQPRAQAQMMAVPQFQAPEVKQGVQGSGLWRFLGGK